MVNFVRSNAACLVARMGHLGESARECAGRRLIPFLSDSEIAYKSFTKKNVKENLIFSPKNCLVPKIAGPI